MEENCSGSWVDCSYTQLYCHLRQPGQARWVCYPVVGVPFDWTWICSGGCFSSYPHIPKERLVILKKALLCSVLLLLLKKLTIFDFLLKKWYNISVAKTIAQ